MFGYKDIFVVEILVIIRLICTSPKTNVVTTIKKKKISGS